MIPHAITSPGARRPAATYGGTVTQLPLFPLGTVLFPGGPLPLHVFEPRYIELLRDVLHTDERQFGIIAIRCERGPGVPELHQVGCAARVESVRRVEGGAFGIIVRGTRRFEVERVRSTQASYLVGDVWWLDQQPDPNDDVASGLADLKSPIQAATAKVRTLAESYAAMVSEEIDLSQEPAQLCQQVADLLALALPDRQCVLKAGDEAHRLHYLSRLLSREVRLSRTFGPLGPLLTDRPHSN